MSKIQVAEFLTDKEYQLLLKVHKSHTQAMGKETRKDYTLADIVEVKRNYEENCLDVKFKIGDYWHYYGNGTWG